MSGSSAAPSLRVSMNPLIEVRGVLSSWVTFATKSDRIFSSFLTVVMSWIIIRVPMVRLCFTLGLIGAVITFIVRFFGQGSSNSRV